MAEKLVLNLVFSGISKLSYLVGTNVDPVVGEALVS